MQNNYCTEHFDTTGWFLVISLARNKQTNKNFCRFEQKPEEYILIFFPGPCCWRRAQSGAEKEGLQRSVSRCTKTVEAFEDNISAIYRVPTQVCKVWSRMFVISGLWKDDKLQEMWDEIHSASGRSNSLFCRNPGSLQTLNFSYLLLKNWRLPGHSGHPDARFNSPVNGLESSALLLQFNTVLIYFIFIYIYCIYIFTSSTVILCMIEKNKITWVAFPTTAVQTTSADEAEDGRWD